jgi:transcriptional antiterminator RfaH
MHWYLIHTKPRQELRALENLQRQGYECYLPLLPTEKIQQKLVAIVDEPLFPRYLFIRLDSSQSGKSWTPIRSTLGVSKLVTLPPEKRTAAALKVTGPAPMAKIDPPQVAVMTGSSVARSVV